MILPGQPVVDVVLGAQDLVDLPPHVRLVFLIPHHLEDGVAGRRETVAGGQVPFVRVNAFEKGGYLLLGADIRPDRRGCAQQTSVSIHRHRPQAVTRDCQRHDGFPVRLAGLEQPAGALDHCLPPIRRPLLVPAHLRISVAYGTKALARQLPAASFNDALFPPVPRSKEMIFLSMIYPCL